MLRWLHGRGRGRAELWDPVAWLKWASWFRGLEVEGFRGLGVMV